jgi:transcriptional regulator with XRE-family HTH domain
MTEQQIGQRIRAARLARRLTQQQLADRMTGAGHKTGHTAVSRIEAGDRPLLVSELFALAAIFGITPAGLLGGDTAINDSLAVLWQRVEQLEAIRERYGAICRITGRGQPEDQDQGQEAQWKLPPGPR